MLKSKRRKEVFFRVLFLILLFIVMHETVHAIHYLVKGVEITQVCYFGLRDDSPALGWVESGWVDKKTQFTSEVMAYIIPGIIIMLLVVKNQQESS